MFFKGLKEKSIQKAITKVNGARVLNDDKSAIKTLGLIVNTNDVALSDSDIKKIEAVFSNANSEIILFTNEHKKTNQENGLTSPKNIGWRAVLKSEELKSFSSQNFDVLITLSYSFNLYLNAITAMSTAKFKVSTSEHNQELCDLSLTMPHFDADMFTFELKKYLTILKRI